jgi:hypothetical protein
MQNEPLNLHHQELLETKFSALNLPLSEYSFANLYLFRTLHHYEVLGSNIDIFIKGMTRDKVPFVMLTSPPWSYSVNSIHSALKYADILFPIPESWLSFFEKELTQASFKDEESDYLFALKKLAYYPGRNLSKKRNLVKQLQAQHKIQSAILIDHTEHAIEILEKWRQDHHENPGETDYEACLEAIQNCQQLRLNGRIIYIDDQPAGFTIGEIISNDCYVIHFCKGLRNIHGLYQYLYQDIAQSVVRSCSWINLEQDLGLPALRNSKHSYLPDRYLVKWRLKLR